MLTHEADIFKEKREALEVRQQQLAAKIASVKQLQAQLILNLTKTAKDDGRSADDENEKEARWVATEQLWLALSATHKMRFIGGGEKAIPAHVLDTFDVVPARDVLLANHRWRHCGFRPTANDNAKDPHQHSSRDPLHALSTLALEMLVKFMQRFDKKAAKVVLAFAQDRAKFGNNLVSTVNTLIKYAAIALGLLEQLDDLTLGALPATRASKAPGWALFSAKPSQVEAVFQSTFELMLLAFDEAYLSLTTRVKRMPSMETGISALEQSKGHVQSVLAQRPLTLNSLWQLWTESRIRNHVEAVAAPSSSSTSSSSASSSSSSSSARPASPHYFAGGDDDEEDEDDDEDEDEDDGEREREAEEKAVLRRRSLRDPDASPKVQHKASVCNMPTKLIGKSKILTKGEIFELEKASPPYFQVSTHTSLLLFPSSPPLSSLTISCFLLLLLSRSGTGRSFSPLTCTGPTWARSLRGSRVPRPRSSLSARREAWAARALPLGVS